MSPYRPEGSTICVAIESNTSQWHTAAHWGFTSRAMIQMMCDITGVIPKEADTLTNQEVVLEIEDQFSIIEVSRVIQGLFHWGGQAITVDSVVATQDSITEIIKEWEVQREKQKELEQEQQGLRENQQECQ